MKKIFKSIGYGLAVPFVLLATIFGLLFAKRKAKKYKKDPNSVLLLDRYKVVYKLFSKFLFIKRVKIESEGFDSLPLKQMLIIANHKSILDPMVIFNTMYDTGKLGATSFVCKNELSKHWYTRVVIELLDGIFIQRDNGRSIYNCYLTETQQIKKGYSIMVFPEGTRVVGDQFGLFKPAILKVAFENFIAIEPIAIYGSDIKRKSFNNKTVHIAALKPVQPNNFINTEQEHLMESLKKDITDKYVEFKLVALEKK